MIAAAGSCSSRNAEILSREVEIDALRRGIARRQPRSSSTRASLEVDAGGVGPRSGPFRDHRAQRTSAALTRVLGEPSFADAARGIAAEIAQMATVDEVATAVEEHIAGR